MTAFHYREIISLIPESIFNRFALQCGVDYKVGKLFGKDIFNLLLYSVLEKEELSLRTIEENYKILFNSKTRHSSLASRLETISVDYFAQMFKFLSTTFLSKHNQKKLTIIDSTTLQLSSKLLEFGVPCSLTRQGQKNSIKLVVATDGEVVKHFNLHTEKEKSGDTTLFREMILKHGLDSICVFDRGLQKRKTFNEFNEENIKFVTRGNDNIRYKVVKKNGIETVSGYNLEIKEDLIVNLGEKGSRFLKNEIRLIKTQDKKTQKEYFFLTNIEDLGSYDICEIYKQRWSIEVFFRFIKQELNTKHFLGRNKNAIQVVLYMILIASILIIEYMCRSKISSFKFARRGFMNELKLEIFKPVVKHCGGDPEKVYSYYKDVFNYAVL